ncbi:MAG: cytochrome c biogenesis CcdA family protein, partial [Halodesulfurarchaeum sp.]
SAGIASFFAPCAFPLLPGYVGYYTATVDTDVTLGSAVLRGGAAGVGALSIFAVFSIVVVTVGRELLHQVRFIEPLIGLVLVALGLSIVLDRMPTWHVQLPGRQSSVLGFAVFGAGYATAASGCFAPVFIAVLLEAMTLSLASGLLTVAAFGGGMAGLLFAFTVAIAIGHDLGGSALPQYADRIKPIAGAIIALAGAYQLYESLELLGWL